MDQWLIVDIALSEVLILGASTTSCISSFRSNAHSDFCWHLQSHAHTDLIGKVPMKLFNKFITLNFFPAQQLSMSVLINLFS